VSDMSAPRPTPTAYRGVHCTGILGMLAIGRFLRTIRCKSSCTYQTSTPADPLFTTDSVSGKGADTEPVHLQLLLGGAISAKASPAVVGAPHSAAGSPAQGQHSLPSLRPLEGCKIHCRWNAQSLRQRSSV
jgi:hypothetical protein